MTEEIKKDSSMVDVKSVFKLLECPVCLEIIHIPIFQCFQGHLICKKCTKELKSCPICRDEMPSKPIRNLALETMIENYEFDCRNSHQGCQTKLKQAGFKDHSLDCPYETRDFCKILSLYQNLVVQTCDKQIRKADIAEHMKTYHNLKGVTGNKAEVIQALESFAQSLMWVPVYFQVHDTVFFLIGGYCHTTEAAKWNCIVAGSSKAAKAFQVKMTLSISSPKTRITWEGPVLGMNRTQTYTKHATFAVTKETLEAFSQNDSPIKPEWKIRVVIKKQQTEEVVAPTQETYPSLGSLSVALNEILIPSSSTKNGNKMSIDHSISRMSEVHQGVTCDSCRTGIIGQRYKCLQCSDYDLCANCNKNGLHDHHLFIRVARESQRSRAMDIFRRVGNGKPPLG